MKRSFKSHFENEDVMEDTEESLHTDQPSSSEEHMERTEEGGQLHEKYKTDEKMGDEVSFPISYTGTTPRKIRSSNIFAFLYRKKRSQSMPTIPPEDGAPCPDKRAEIFKGCDTSSSEEHHQHHPHNLHESTTHEKSESDFPSPAIQHLSSLSRRVQVLAGLDSRPLFSYCPPYSWTAFENSVPWFYPSPIQPHPATRVEDHKGSSSRQVLEKEIIGGTLRTRNNSLPETPLALNALSSPDKAAMSEVCQPVFFPPLSSSLSVKKAMDYRRHITPEKEGDAPEMSLTESADLVELDLSTSASTSSITSSHPTQSPVRVHASRKEGNRLSLDKKFKSLRRLSRRHALSRLAGSAPAGTPPSQSESLDTGSSRPSMATKRTMILLNFDPSVSTPAKSDMLEHLAEECNEFDGEEEDDSDSEEEEGFINAMAFPGEPWVGSTVEGGDKEVFRSETEHFHTVTMEAPVTAVSSSVFSTQPSSSPLQVHSSGPVWTQRSSSGLPRSHSCPHLSSLSPAPSAEVEAFPRAKSLPAMPLQNKHRKRKMQTRAYRAKTLFPPAGATAGVNEADSSDSSTWSYRCEELEIYDDVVDKVFETPYQLCLDLDPISDALDQLEQRGFYTASISSVFSTQLSSSPLQVHSSGPGWTQRSSSGLPRFHSCPHLSSLSPTPSAEVEAFPRAKSLPALPLQSSFEEFTPDVTVDEPDETYQFQCPWPGLYQCTLTGLVFDMDGDGDVVYRVVPWNRRLLAQHHKQPAGPLFDISCAQKSVRQLHLPHCEIRPTAGPESLAVAHVNDDGIEFIVPHKTTETHVIINVTSFSGFGNVKDEDSPPDPVKAMVLLFYRPPAGPDPESVLNVLLLPGNAVLRDVVRIRKKLVGDERYIETSPQCKLAPKQKYTLSTFPDDDSVLVQPKEAEFDNENYDNYFPSFQVDLEQILRHIKLNLSDGSSSSSVWERRVCLSSSAVKKSCRQNGSDLPPNEKLLHIRSGFVDGVSRPVLKSLLDRLLERKVMCDSEKESVDAIQTKREQARSVIDTVRKKGKAASSELIEILCELDEFLCDHLGLI